MTWEQAQSCPELMTILDEMAALTRRRDLYQRYNEKYVPALDAHLAELELKGRQIIDEFDFDPLEDIPL